MSLLSSSMTFHRDPNVFGTTWRIKARLLYLSTMQPPEPGRRCITQMAERHHLLGSVRCFPGGPSSPLGGKEQGW